MLLARIEVTMAHTKIESMMASARIAEMYRSDRDREYAGARIQ